MTIAAAFGADLRRVFRGLHPLLISEARLMRRNPALIIWVGILPLVATMVLASIPATREPADYLAGQSWFGIYQPILVMFSSLMLSVQILPDVLTRYRERGILRRLRTTPASPAALLFAEVILIFAIEVAMLVALVVLPLIPGAPLPKNPIGFVIAFVFSAVALMAIGMMIASVCRTNKVATAAGTVLFFVLMFFAGLWWPRDTMPGWMLAISDATPTGAAVAALTDAAQGGWPSWLDLAVMLAWGVVLAIVAVRLFRWD
ncbi:ABC transporter permease [Gordonia rhizosphera]|uniref:Transport permease protein n=1 Tax=Gordonia rhizosphera NBRC 16068 TaxID=1108045 RepID=K6WHN2_9ACTN|nr:ABC transporter permease [Gordonia rhizosphera]GAB91672.1 putative ABC transporter permease protein [Gordonia rhizosphera NBRC 16068]